MTYIGQRCVRKWSVEKNHNYVRNYMNKILDSYDIERKHINLTTLSAVDS